jgi:hypothetical protein
MAAQFEEDIIMAKMTDKEAFEIILAARAADAQGDEKKASRLRRSLPLPIHLAEFMKKEFGPQYLIEGGWNLSEVEEQYGKNWINR